MLSFLFVFASDRHLQRRGRHVAQLLTSLTGYSLFLTL